MRVGVCVECGRTREIHARGLCHSQCYQRLIKPSRAYPPDEVVVYLLTEGRLIVTARRKERRVAAGILLDRGQLSQRQIAERIGVSKRLVERIAAERRGTDD